MVRKIENPTPEQIEARKIRQETLKLKAEKDLNNIVDANVSDREYNAKFSKIYTSVREGLVVLKAKKTLGELTGEGLYNETIEFINSCLDKY